VFLRRPNIARGGRCHWRCAVPRSSANPSRPPPVQPFPIIRMLMRSLTS
jgi:hypothetical protein